ncbi:MAG: ABC transporter ATP-binding protein [Gemmatimonadaceae bacterium]
MIEIRDLHKRYGRLDVLRGVDLSLRTGRVTGLVGPNSAGKTTLIKSVLGLVRPDRGAVLVGGAPVDADGLYRARIGYMPQIARFPENLTGAELVDMLRSLRRGDARLAPRPEDDELVSRLGLAPHMQKRLRELSGGTRQKLNAVLAFLFTPDVLILDEPTAGLDPVASAALKDKLLAARGAGCTVLVTSHVLSELEELCDDVAFLVEGRVAFAGSAVELASVTGEQRLERAVAKLMMREAA